MNETRRAIRFLVDLVFLPVMLLAGTAGVIGAASAGIPFLSPVHRLAFALLAATVI